jgi:hypothetical protein
VARDALVQDMSIKAVLNTTIIGRYCNLAMLTGLAMTRTGDIEWAIARFAILGYEFEYEYETKGFTFKFFLDSPLCDRSIKANF